MYPGIPKYEEEPLEVLNDKNESIGWINLKNGTYKKEDNSPTSSALKSPLQGKIRDRDKKTYTFFYENVGADHNFLIIDGNNYHCYRNGQYIENPQDDNHFKTKIEKEEIEAKKVKAASPAPLPPSGSATSVPEVLRYFKTQNTKDNQNKFWQRLVKVNGELELQYAERNNEKPPTEGWQKHELKSGSYDILTFDLAEGNQRAGRLTYQESTGSYELLMYREKEGSVEITQSISVARDSRFARSPLPTVAPIPPTDEWLANPIVKRLAPPALGISAKPAAASPLVPLVASETKSSEKDASRRSIEEISQEIQNINEWASFAYNQERAAEDRLFSCYIARNTAVGKNEPLTLGFLTYLAYKANEAYQELGLGEAKNDNKHIVHITKQLEKLRELQQELYKYRASDVLEGWNKTRDPLSAVESAINSCERNLRSIRENKDNLLRYYDTVRRTPLGKEITIPKHPPALKQEDSPSFSILEKLQPLREESAGSSSFGDDSYLRPIGTQPPSYYSPYGYNPSSYPPVSYTGAGYPPAPAYNPLYPAATTGSSTLGMGPAPAAPGARPMGLTSINLFTPGNAASMDAIKNIFNPPGGAAAYTVVDQGTSLVFTKSLPPPIPGIPQPPSGGTVTVYPDRISLDGCDVDEFAKSLELLKNASVPPFSMDKLQITADLTATDKPKFDRALAQLANTNPQWGLVKIVDATGVPVPNPHAAAARAPRAQPQIHAPAPIAAPPALAPVAAPGPAIQPPGVSPAAAPPPLPRPPYAIPPANPGDHTTPALTPGQPMPPVSPAPGIPSSRVGNPSAPLANPSSGAPTLFGSMPGSGSIVPSTPIAKGLGNIAVPPSSASSTAKTPKPTATAAVPDTPAPPSGKSFS